MTPKQANQIYRLSAQTEWGAFVEYKTERLNELHKQLELCGDKELPHIQGQIAEIRRDLNIRITAEAILKMENRDSL